MNIYRFLTLTLLLFTNTILFSNTAFGAKPLATVSGTIADAATQESLPARVHVRDDKGRWHLIHSEGGDQVHYRREVARLPNSPEVHTTLSAHPFRVQLPPGRYTFRVERGKEYLPIVRTIDVADQPVQLKFSLQRWINMSQRGWYSGDTHVHRSLDELPNVVMAEDLNVALPLSNWVTKSDTAPSQGDRSVATELKPRLIRVDDTHVIYPMNTEYEIFYVGDRSHTLGAVFVLNHKRPLTIGAPPVQPIAQWAREDGALLDLDKHSWPWSLMLVPVMKVDLFELSNNHVWQTPFGFHDWTVEMVPPYMELERTEDGQGLTEWGWINYGFQTYYALLNSGYHLRVSAGTASGVHPVQLGFGRVYVHLPDGFGYEDWMQGLDAGRSFVSTGPMLETRFGDYHAGETISPPDSTAYALKIVSTATSRKPLDRIEIVMNGDVIRTLSPENRLSKTGAFVTNVTETINLDSSAWCAVRCFEEDPKGRIRFAHTNPVHVLLPDKPLRPKKVEVQSLIDRMQAELIRNRDVIGPVALDEYRQAMSAFQALLKSAR